MKKISLLTVIMSIFGVTYVYAAEGHSHELPEFLHFMEELIEEHSILRGFVFGVIHTTCLLYTSPSPRDRTRSRMPSSA